ncbi:MAG: helix-turn-helix domain-containing protein [Bacteroidota bacterium]
MSRKVSLTTEETYLLADYMQDIGNQKMSRRLLAISLRHFGYKIKDIALIIGVSEKSISNWIKLFLSGGFEALLEKHYPKHRNSKLEPYIGEIRQYRQENPEAKLTDLQAWLQETYDLEVEYSWLYRYLDRHEL